MKTNRIDAIVRRSPARENIAIGLRECRTEDGQPFYEIALRLSGTLEYFGEQIDALIGQADVAVVLKGLSAAHARAVAEECRRGRIVMNRRDTVRNRRAAVRVVRERIRTAMDHASGGGHASVPPSNADT